MESWLNLSWITLETLAVVLAFGYLAFAIQENSLCWYFVFFSAAIYVWIFFDARLYMVSLLNVYYVLMSLYGWQQWRRGGAQQTGLLISRLTPLCHILVVGLVSLFSLIIGYFLGAYTDAELPYLDSFTTLGSIVTTAMVARKILENWLYWIFIDGVSIYLYFSQNLYQTAVLFVLYVILAILGYGTWRKRYLEQNNL